MTSPLSDCIKKDTLSSDTLFSSEGVKPADYSQNAAAIQRELLEWKQIYKWINCFKNGWISLCDEHQKDRTYTSKNMTTVAVKQMIYYNQQIKFDVVKHMNRV